MYPVESRFTDFATSIPQAQPHHEHAPCNTPVADTPVQDLTNQFNSLSIENNFTPSEMQFAEMIDACNCFLWMRSMGHIQESTDFIKVFSNELMGNTIAESEVTHTLLFSLFTNFSDPLKGLYYLYQISLYTLPLRTESPVSTGITENGSVELQMRFKNITSTLYFPPSFEDEIDPLTQEESSTVTEWFGHFMQLGRFTSDPSRYAPFLKAKIPVDSPFKIAFECEEALFGKESPSYDLFFDLSPLGKLSQYCVARICAQYDLRGQIGFDLYERALQEQKTASDVAWAFIQDSMRLAPIAIKRIAPKLIQELKDDKLLLKWINHALLNDKELARTLLRHASSLTAQDKTTLLQKLLKEEESPLFDIAIYAPLLEGMLEHATVDSSLKKEAIALYQKFFPKLTLKSPQELAITHQAIKLSCKDSDTTFDFLTFIFDLAKSVLEAIGRSELANNGSDVLLWYPNRPVESAKLKKTIENHLNDESLTPWKDRFFEIACSFMHTLLEEASTNENENGIRLRFVAKMIHNISSGNVRRKNLVPIFEKMIFSPLSISSGHVYQENYNWFQQLYPSLTPYFDLYPSSAYKIALLASHIELVGNSPLQPEEKRALFNEVLDFQIRAIDRQQDRTIISDLLSRTFTLFIQAAQSNTFQLHFHFLTAAKKYVTPSILKKALQITSWETATSKLYHLLSYNSDNSQYIPNEQRELCLLFIKTLLSNTENAIFEKGKELFFTSVEKDIYQGQIIDEKGHKELMGLLNRVVAPENTPPLPDRSLATSIKGCCQALNRSARYFSAIADDENLHFWINALLDHLTNERKEAASSLEKGLFLKCTKHIKDPAIFTHPAITKLLSKSEYKQACGNFLQGMLEQAIITDCPKQIEKAIGLYYEFFPKLELKSAKEQAVTRLATILFSKNFASDTISFPSLPLAYSILKAEGHPEELAKMGAEILLWSPDKPFNSSTSQKSITSHIKNKKLDCWKSRLFEITKDVLCKIIDRKTQDAQECTIQLLTVANQIEAISKGNSRAKDLVPVFEKLLFSLLNTWNAQENENNFLLIQRVYQKILTFQDDHPSSIYKMTWIIKGKEWEQCPLKTEERLSLFTELLDFVIESEQPLALLIILNAMIEISKKGSLFGKNDAMKVIMLIRIIKATFEMPYEKGALFDSMDASNPEIIPLLRILVDCIASPTQQLITYDNKNAAASGYPLVKMMTEKFVSLCTTAEDDCPITPDEYVEMIFCLWERAAKHHLFQTNAQYVEMLKLCLSTPLLQKILTTTSWENYLTSYSRLLLRSPVDPNKPSQLLRELLLQYMTELNKISDKQIAARAKEILNEVIKEGLSAKNNNSQS